jgi:anti-sigma factor RsiW
MMAPMADSVEPGLTIRCEQLVELVTDYLEGALDSETRTELEAHLALCPACSEFVRQMQATLRMVGHVPLATLSPTAKADLLVAFRDLPRGGE